MTVTIQRITNIGNTLPSGIKFPKTPFYWEIIPIFQTSSLSFPTKQTGIFFFSERNPGDIGIRAPVLEYLLLVPGNRKNGCLPILQNIYVLFIAEIFILNSQPFLGVRKFPVLFDDVVIWTDCYNNIPDFYIITPIF